jgi:hypothetical protein
MRRISYKQYNEGKLIGLVISWAGTAFYNTLIEGRIKGKYK